MSELGGSTSSRRAPVRALLAAATCALLTAACTTGPADPLPSGTGAGTGIGNEHAQHGGMPMVAVPAAARVPSAPDLTTAGWSVTTTSAVVGHLPGAATDGDVTTSWRSRPGARHVVVLDTGVPQAVGSLRYTPPAGDRASDVDTYVVEASLDGVHWKERTSGRWASDALAKTATFAPTSARFVRLTLRGASTDRAVAVAELALVGVPDTSPTPRPASPRGAAAPGRLGRWSEPLGLPIVPVSAIALPHGKVLTFAAYSGDNYDQTSTLTQVSIVDVGRRRAGQREISDTEHQMFCTGLSVLADGRVLITGGSSASTTTIYDPRSNEFSRGPQMVVPRGYQTSVTLSDGRSFTIGGSWSGGEGGKDAEVLDRSLTGWQPLPGVTADSILTGDAAGVYRADNHAWLFAGPGGSVFHAGPSRQMNWFTTTGEGSTRPAGDRGDALDAMNGNAVMYADGRILTVGGAENYSESDALVAAHTIDIRGGPSTPVTTRRVGDLPTPRTLANSVVLPDGDVLVTGGQRYSLPFTDLDSVMEPALWSSRTGTFRHLAPAAVPRNYHSWSLLLPDARVLVGGGGLCFECETDHPDVELLTPPYLLRADGSLRPRPRVLSRVPSRVRAGATLTIRTSTPVRSWSALRTGSATHSVNSDQRRVVLPARRVAGRANTYRVSIPARRGTTVPGSYLLFGVDASGTPTRGAWVVIP